MTTFLVTKKGKVLFCLELELGYDYLLETAVAGDSGPKQYNKDQSCDWKKGYRTHAAHPIPYPNFQGESPEKFSLFSRPPHILSLH